MFCLLMEMQSHKTDIPTVLMKLVDYRMTILQSTRISPAFINSAAIFAQVTLGAAMRHME